MSPLALAIGDHVRLRKAHPCGADVWEVVRLGADIGLRCRGCGHRILIERSTLKRRLKAVVGAASRDSDRDALLGASGDSGR